MNVFRLHRCALKKYVYLAACLLFPPIVNDKALAGAWVQEQGNGLNITTISYYDSSQYWDPNRKLKDSPTYSKIEVNQYIEYGI